MQHKDGHWVWVHDRGRVITRAGDGKPLMMFGVHAEISRRKHNEEALKKAHSELELRVLGRTVALKKSKTQ